MFSLGKIILFRKWKNVDTDVLISHHTYIIVHYNPSVRIIDLVSHTTHIMYVNFMRELGDLKFEVDFEQEIF